MNDSSQVEPPIFELGDSKDLVARLCFQWHGDRFGHRLEILDRQQISLCLESQEDTGDSSWPSSPPLQQLMQHQTGGQRPCTLLLGMAGRSHWSLSVEQESSYSLLFDVACRVQTQPGWLGSCYQTSQPTLRCEDSLLVVPCRNHSRQILLEAVEDDTTQNLQLNENGFAIVAPCDVDRFPATVRWKYRLRLSDPTAHS